MSLLIRGIRGFRDIPAEEAFRHRYAEDRTREHFALYGYREVRLPLVESTELFARGIGEATDIVEKEMYTFEDRNGASLTLRPEGTASAVRAYLEGGWKSQGRIAKIFYTGPMFRYERPQKGRYRQFYQVGLEAVGGAGPMVDAEVIDLLHRLFVRLKVDNVKILVNSLGCSECRPAFREKLLAFIQGKTEELCANCVRRTGSNPLRVLDCKVPSCREALTGAPVILDDLCAECDDHFKRVLEALTGLDVPHEVDPGIVRGLDYYNRTAFEAVCTGLGAQNAVAAGGRYDGLAREIGGDVPGIGFAIGLERLTLVMDWEGLEEAGPDFFVASATTAARVPAMALADTLREQGFAVQTDLEDRSLKAQFRSAHRMGAARVLILGDDELAEGSVQVKDFATGEQVKVVQEKFVEGLKGPPRLSGSIK
ncbi:MAG: histidine--tRNA ligase [bacterium]|nr:histidine--tRNA ligase [bacterium]MDT8396315.1 histidine--tRNA ligase [bacterium]